MHRAPLDVHQLRQSCDEQGTLVLTGGRFLVDPENGRSVTALAVAGGRVTAHDAAARSLIDAGADHLDLGGRTLLPGFIDAHAHLGDLAASRLALRLGDARSPREILERVAAALVDHPAGQPLIGDGWDETSWSGGSALLGTDLDRLSAEVPIVLRRVCMHKAVANRAAVTALLARAPEQDEPATIDRPSGVLLEAAAMRARELFRPGPEAMAAALRAVCNEAAALGITGVHEIDGPPALERIIEETARHGPLAVRILFHLSIGDADRLATHRSLARRLSARDDLRLGGIKLYLDGSIGARTAALDEPFAGEPATRGQLLYTTDALIRLVQEIDARGIQLMMHAIGDRAIALALDALEALGPAAVRAARHRLEHVELLPDPLLERVARLGVTVCMQPNFVRQWQGVGGLYEQQLGRARRRWMNRFRSILDAGVPLAFGSDCMPLGPLGGIGGAVHHPQAGERLTPGQAVAAYTTAAAAASPGAPAPGRLLVGDAADLVILEGDPSLDASPVTIGVEATVAGGRLTYPAR